ncbi:MAG: serine hydrolase domain-containing protein [Candidatus Binatia bacterium]
MTALSTDLVRPAEVGVDEEKLEALLVRARREIDQGLLPSCQLAVAREGRLVAFETYGDAPADARYCIMSSTKAFVASAIWILLGEGKLVVSNRVADHVPEFGANGKGVVSLEQVLLHTAGFPSAFLNPFEWDDRTKRLETFASWELEWEPGSMYRYHGLSGWWVLAELIERCTGGDFRAFVHERVVRPLGLERFDLGAPPDEQGDVQELVRTGELPSRQELEEAWGISELPAAWISHDQLLFLNDPGVRAVGIPAGGAVSTAADVALFYQGLLHNPAGQWDPAVVAECTRLHHALPDDVGVQAPRGLGVQLSDGEGAARLWRGFGYTNSSRAFGHDGAGGMIAWADPETGISFCYLTNGLDDNLVRQKRRMAGIASRAASVAS